MRAERHVARGRSDRQADLGFEPLPGGVDEGDRSDGRVADQGREVHQVVERLFGGRIEDLVEPQRSQSLGLVGGQSRRLVAKGWWNLRHVVLFG